jgi:transposase-like protein
MSVTKRKFTRDFKIKVVQEVESGIKTRAQVNREYELSEGLVAKWIYAYRKDPGTAFTGQSVNNETDRLKAKITRLEWALGRKTMENEILKQTLEGLGVKKGN